MAVITLGVARKIVAPYVGKSGKCADSDEVRLIVMEIVQRLLHKGAHGNLRKYCFHVCNGCITIPPEIDLGVPLKVKIDGYPEKVWSKWYEFHDVTSYENCDGYSAAGLTEEVDPTYTIYDLPCGGAKIFALPLCEEEADAHIIVQGIDINGRDVYIEHKGNDTHGEYLEVNKALPKLSNTVFKKITGIKKSKTKNYVRLYWRKENGKTGLLAEYRPFDEFPSYKRLRVMGAEANCCVKLTVLGRIKDSLDYYHDNDVLPITNLAALKKMGQAIQAEDNDNIRSAQYKENKTTQLIDDEHQYNKSGESHWDFLIETSPGSIYNMQ